VSKEPARERSVSVDSAAERPLVVVGTKVEQKLSLGVSLAGSKGAKSQHTLWTDPVRDIIQFKVGQTLPIHPRRCATASTGTARVA